jgi:hypothetical protein
VPIGILRIDSDADAGGTRGRRAALSVAPESHVQVSIDDDVEFLSEQLEKLRELGQQKEADDAFGDEDIYDFSVRWGTALSGRLPRLVHYSSLGLLDEADQRRFESLREELRRVSDLAEELGLPRPVLTGEEAATVKGHRHLRIRSHFPKRGSRS